MLPLSLLALALASSASAEPLAGAFAAAQAAASHPAVDAALARLASPHQNVRLEALRELELAWRSAGPAVTGRAVRELIRAGRMDPSKFVRGSALTTLSLNLEADALPRREAELAAEALADAALLDADLSLRAEVMWELSRAARMTGKPAPVAAAARALRKTLLSKADLEARRAAATHLSLLEWSVVPSAVRDETRFDLALVVATDADLDVRVGAAATLSALGDGAAALPLVAELEKGLGGSSDEALAAVARLKLIYLGAVDVKLQNAAAQALGRALEHAPMVKGMAAVALGEAPEKAGVALPALEAAIAGLPDGALRNVLLDVLDRIRA